MYWVGGTEPLGIPVVKNLKVCSKNTGNNMHYDRYLSKIGQ